MLMHVLREYNVNIILLSNLGLWPLQNKFVKILLPILYIAFQTSWLAVEIIMLYDHWENTQLVFEGLYIMSVVSLCIIKLCNELWNNDKIRYSYEAMENHWNVFTSEFEMRVLKEYSNVSRKYTIIYLSIISAGATIFLSVPFKPILLDIILPLNQSRPRYFAVTIEWRIDEDKHFVPMFFYIIIITVSSMIILIGVDTIYITRIIHACSLFHIISQQFEKMKSEPDYKVSKHRCYKNALFKLTSEQVMYEEYVICLKKYQLALKFVDALNSIHQTVALISLLFGITAVSLVGIKIIYVLDQLDEVFKYIVVILGVLMQLMVLCYPGQKLLDESQNVFYQIYAAEWYTFSPRLKSLLIITLHRSFTPCGLKAGNLFSVSMTTYAAVVRTGISFFTTFLSIRD